MKRKLSLVLLLAMLVTCFTGCDFLFSGTGEEAVQSGGECLVGQTVVCGDIEFTFKSVELYVDNSSIIPDVAAEGKEFIVLNLEAKNVGDADDYVNSLYEDSYCDDAAVDPEFSLYNYNGDTIWGDVAAGRVRKGYVAYEVSVGWEKIELIYEPFLEDKVTFVVYSSDVQRSNTTNNGSSNADKTPSGGNTNSSDNNTNQGNNTESVAACLVGETVTVNNIQFTFMGIEKYVDTSDWEMDTPASGCEFVILKIKAKNVGSESAYLNMYYEDSYCDDVATDPELLLYNYNGDTIWGDIAAGKSREGYVAYELPVGWDKIEFTYNLSLTSSNSVTFVGYSTDIK